MDTAIKKIIEIRDALGEGKLRNQPEALSQAAVSLARYNAVLAGYLAGLEQAAKDGYLIEYKRLRDTTDMTQGDAEVAAKLAASPANQKYNDAYHIYKSTQNFISTIQSHLSTLRTERNNGGLDV